MLAGAVDFGGTKLMAGLVNETGTIVAQQTAPTPKAEGPEAAAALAALMLRDLVSAQGLTTADLVGVGSTVPGLADSRRGILRYAPAHDWRDVPFAAMLTEQLGLPARIANDVNACALAELRFGAGRGVTNLLWITVSTGIGGALILDGRIHQGGGGIAGEVGHLIVDEEGPLCGCGHRGCLEAVAAGPAIALRAQARGLFGADTPMVLALARRGEPLASQVVRETAVYLGKAIALCYNLVDPDLVVFGGGVGQHVDLMKETILSVVRERAILLPARPPRIEKTSLGYEAALIGAAALVLEGEAHVG